MGYSMAACSDEKALTTIDHKDHKPFIHYFFLIIVPYNQQQLALQRIAEPETSQEADRF